MQIDVSFDFILCLDKLICIMDETTYILVAEDAVVSPPGVGRGAEAAFGAVSPERCRR